MIMFRMIGLFAFIPAAVLLTVSFFVLFTLRKTETHGLKAFGYVITALLWVSTLLVLSSGVYTISTGRCPMMEQMMRAKVMNKWECAPSMREGKKQMMMKEKMPAMTEGKTNEPMMKH